ncbi:MAG TPA: LCP family protein [Dehalococcoidia bacterium]|nr:LCP family protein [Dehalococcoidia bacterium]
MENDWSSNGGHEAQDYGHYRARGHFSIGMIAFIIIFAIISFWSFAVVSTRVIADGGLLPGNEPNPFGITKVIPGAKSVDNDEPATPDERINILLLGLDQRLDDAGDEPYRTDSIVVFTIDPHTKTAGAFSIPRDSLVEVPDGEGGIYTETRINEAYELGEYLGLRGYDGGGGQLAIDTIEHNFGIPIDHYIVMNWASFIEIIDELGGIDVDVPEYAYDPAYSDCSFCSDVYPVEFVQGPEHMDGDRALAYARIRKSDNDYKRIERQQIVMRAVATKALQLDFLDVGKAKGLYDKYTQSVKTNIPGVKVPGLALLGKQVGAENIRMVSMAPATYPCGAPCQGVAYLLWDPEKVEELKALLFNDSLLAEEYASVEILNGTVIPNLATNFKDYIAIRGVDATKVTVDEYADGFLYDSSLIIDVHGDVGHTAGKIAEWLGIPSAHVVSGTDAQAAPFLGTGSQVVVVLGGDVEESFGSFAQAP